MTFTQRISATAVTLVTATLRASERLNGQGRIGHGHTVAAIRVVSGGEFGGISHETARANYAPKTQAPEEA